MCDNEDLLVDVEAVGGSIEDLAVSLRTVTMPDTRENVVLGVLLELWKGKLERDGVANIALAGRRCKSKVPELATARQRS